MASPSPPSSKNWPTTVEDTVTDILANMSETDKDTLRKMPKKQVAILHFGFGTHIRNHYGLLQGNEQLLRAACGRKIFCDPDQASGRIIEAVWDALQKS